MFHVPEPNRVTTGSILSSDSTFGNYGYFRIRLSNSTLAHCIVSEGEGWEHVSVHMDDQKVKGIQRTPTWSEMCKIKDIFWDDQDCIAQYHPPKEDYINNHKHTLHLWRPTNVELPRPPWILVGTK